jgi:ABC-type amino acid transport substrate-binding protein
MKKIIAVMLSIVFLALAFASCGKMDGSKDLDTVKKNGVLRVGMECNYPPFNWTQPEASETAVPLEGGGYADGYDVQVAKSIAKHLGVELKVVKLEWEGLVPALESGKIDCIIAGMSPTSERKLKIDFSENYYVSNFVAVVRKDSKYANATSISDFSGAKISAQLDSTMYSVIPQINGVIRETAMKSHPQLTTALIAGKLDAYITELPNAMSAVAAKDELMYIVFGEGNGFTLDEADGVVSIGLRKGSTLCDKMNEYLLTFTEEDRTNLMAWAVENQPLSEVE